MEKNKNKNKKNENNITTTEKRKIQFDTDEEERDEEEIILNQKKKMIKPKNAKKVEINKNQQKESSDKSENEPELSESEEEENSNLTKASKKSSKNDSKKVHGKDSNNNTNKNKPVKDENNNVKQNIKQKPKQGTLYQFQVKIQPSASSIDFSKLTPLPSKNSNISIYSWNINGLRAVLNKGAIDKFIKTEQPDIFCLNETKIDITALKKDKHDKIYSEDYMSFWNCCKIKSGYSGVAIFTKYRPLNVTYGIEKEEHDDEGRVLTMEFEDFYLVSVYVPNAGEGLKRLGYRVDEWDASFFEYLNKLKSTKKDVILCGDLNVAHHEIDLYQPKGHLKSPGFTVEERNSFSSFLEYGYVDTFRHLYPEEVKFTYFTARKKTFKQENKGWRIDYFVVNENAKERVVDSEILYDYDGSDHIPIKLTWKI